MEALTTQNSELRTMLIKATEIKPVPHSSTNSSEDGTEDTNPRDEIVRCLARSCFSYHSLIGIASGAQIKQLHTLLRCNHHEI